MLGVVVLFSSPLPTTFQDLKSELQTGSGTLARAVSLPSIHCDGGSRDTAEDEKTDPAFSLDDKYPPPVWPGLAAARCRAVVREVQRAVAGTHAKKEDGKGWKAVSFESAVATSETVVRMFSSRSSFGVVHFVGTGMEHGGLVLETKETGIENKVTMKQFIDAIQEDEGTRPAVIVSGLGLKAARNAAKTFIAAGAPVVVFIPDTSLILVTSFYAALVNCGPTSLFTNVLATVTEAHPNYKMEILWKSGVNPREFRVSQKVSPWVSRSEFQANEVLNCCPKLEEGLVGRGRELHHLCTAFVNPKVRGILVTGHEGTGKTALVSHAAQFAFERQMLRRVFYVDCRKVTSELTESEVQGSLSVSSRDWLWLLAILTEALAPVVDLELHLASELGRSESHTTSARQFILAKLESPATSTMEFLFYRLVATFRHQVESIDNFVGYRRSLVIFDSCGLEVLANSWFGIFIVKLEEYVDITTLCCTRHPPSFLLKPDYVRINLDAMNYDEAKDVLHMTVDGPNKQSSLRPLFTGLLEQLQGHAICIPRSLMKAASRLAAGDQDIHTIVRSTKEEVNAGALVHLGEVLQKIVNVQSAALGSSLWKTCMASNPIEREPGVVDASVFQKCLQNQFNQRMRDFSMTNLLSTETAFTILHRLKKITPLREGSEHLVSMSRFAAPFWPWWSKLLFILPRLGTLPNGIKIWDAKMPHASPVIWIASRKDAHARLVGKAAGVFSIRLSESQAGALAVDFVSQHGTVHSLLVHLGLDGLIREPGVPDGTSLVPWILARQELTQIYDVEPVSKHTLGNDDPAPLRNKQ